MSRPSPQDLRLAVLALIMFSTPLQANSVPFSLNNVTFGTQPIYGFFRSSSVCRYNRVSSLFQVYRADSGSIRTPPPASFTR